MRYPMVASIEGKRGTIWNAQHRDSLAGKVDAVFPEIPPPDASEAPEEYKEEVTENEEKDEETEEKDEETEGDEPTTEGEAPRKRGRPRKEQ